MSSALAMAQTEVGRPQLSSPYQRAVNGMNVEALSEDDKEEILDFLSRRPIHTVCMAGYIRDHGVVSDLNRGTFYGCRDEEGSLEGVALIGHAILLETQSEEALKAFAQLRDRFENSHLIRGQHELIQHFWLHFSQYGHTPRLACRELLFEQQAAPQIDGPTPQLRLATLAELDEILNINAEMALSESGIDPRKKDPAGFRKRVVQRIEQGRVWVWASNGHLVFKVDIFAETPEMIYLEGVHVREQERGKGHGLRCMAQLGSILLNRSQSICLLVNEQKQKLSAFYMKAGYQLRGIYDTIYLYPQAD